MPLKTNSDQKILAAAFTLFARDGFRGTSTRDIASLAQVNEVTIFRHYRNKRELFRVTVETQLQDLKIQEDLGLRLASTEDPSSAFCLVLNSIARTFADKPNLVRLIQFGLLEFGQEFQSMCRSYLGQWLYFLAQRLDTSAGGRDFGDLDSQLMILAFAANTLNMETFHLFSTQKLSTEEFGRKYWKMWQIILGRMSAGDALESHSRSMAH